MEQQSASEMTNTSLASAEIPAFFSKVHASGSETPQVSRHRRDLGDRSCLELD